jgi:hypothetical protein
MEAKENTMLLEETFADLETQIAAAKKRLEDFITHPGVFLETRWDMWTKAPSYLKNHQNYYPDLSIDNREISWYDEFNVERYQTAELADIMTWALEHDEDFYTVDGIKAFKEQILKLNLGSFVYDW